MGWVCPVHQNCHPQTTPLLSDFLLPTFQLEKSHELGTSPLDTWFHLDHTHSSAEVPNCQWKSTQNSGLLLIHHDTHLSTVPEAWMLLPSSLIIPNLWKEHFSTFSSTYHFHVSTSVLFLTTMRTSSCQVSLCLFLYIFSDSFLHPQSPIHVQSSLISAAQQQFFPAHWQVHCRPSNHSDFWSSLKHSFFSCQFFLFEPTYFIDLFTELKKYVCNKQMRCFTLKPLAYPTQKLVSSLLWIDFQWQNVWAIDGSDRQNVLYIFIWGRGFSTGQGTGIQQPRLSNRFVVCVILAPWKGSFS